jgi:hypothetical protein
VLYSVYIHLPTTAFILREPKPGLCAYSHISACIAFGRLFCFVLVGFEPKLRNFRDKDLKEMLNPCFFKTTDFTDTLFIRCISSQQVLINGSPLPQKKFFFLLQG